MIDAKVNQELKELMSIPGVGKSIAGNLRDIGIRRVADLKGKDPEQLFERSNRHAGTIQDRCLLYVFRCAVYFAETPAGRQDREKLKWWNWQDKPSVRRTGPPDRAVPGR